MATLQEQYDILAELANVAEAGTLAKERSVLLLWYLRNYVGVDDFDAYEYVCDGDFDGGIDGLYLESAIGPSGSDVETLVVYQSKYTIAPSKVGKSAVTDLLSSANKLQTADALKEFLATTIEPKLRRLIERFELLQKLEAGAIDTGALRVRTVLVTSGVANGELLREAGAANKLAGHADYAVVRDLRILGPLATALKGSGKHVPEVSILSNVSERLVVGTSPNRVAQVVGTAEDIVTWSGIADRSLFELNVRREVKMNNVRRQLDAAIQRKEDHKDFLAFHNGLTVTCRKFELVDDTELKLHEVSVVNGAQSVIALSRAAEAGNLTSDLKLFVKIVEVEGRAQLAQEVSRRSNTRKSVNNRNLRAHSGPQKRLVSEFASRFPNYVYETRPDASASYDDKTVIQNDDAAQLLCAVFNQKPWLAVKRLSLFESDNHAEIFSEDIHAEHVVLAHAVQEAVDAAKDEFPSQYRSTWRLTRIVAVYLIAQAMHTGKGALPAALEEPGKALKKKTQLAEMLNDMALIAAATLEQRVDKKAVAEEEDDHSVEFKNQAVLNDLATAMRGNFIFSAKMDRRKGRSAAEKSTSKATTAKTAAAKKTTGAKKTTKPAAKKATAPAKVNAQAKATPLKRGNATAKKAPGPATKAASPKKAVTVPKATLKKVAPKKRT